MIMQQKTIIQPTYTLKIPSKWEFSTSDKSVSLYNPDGVGAITLSSYSITPNTTTGPASEILKKFTAQPDAVLHTEGDMDVAEIEYNEKVDDTTRYQLVFVISNGRQVIIANYNCNADSINPREVREAQNIMQSIELH